MKSKKIMSKSEQLLAFLEDKASNHFNPVDRQEILDFTQQYDIDLREDHLEFLIKYGDAPLLNRGVAKGISFEGFKDHYIEEANDPRIKAINLEYLTPSGILYFGYEDIFPLVINQETGELGDYDESYGLEASYLDIKTFRFYSVCRICNLFDKSDRYQFSSTEEAELYRKEHEKDRLIDIVDYKHDYYYHDHMIIALKKSPGIFYNKKIGGVLNQFEEK